MRNQEKVENSGMLLHYKRAIRVAMLTVFLGGVSPAMAQSSQAVFRHDQFDAVLKKYVNNDGLVDYKGLMLSPGQLQEYIESLKTISLDEMTDNERLALLINAYNAFTLQLILEHYPVKSIQDINRRYRWSDVRWEIGGNIYSLDHIEHMEIRPKHPDPRIHFALVCAAVGCPTLRTEAYHPDRLKAQLNDQTKMVHRDERWFRYDRKKNTVYLTKLYKWYTDDFAKKKFTKDRSGTVLGYVANYSSDLAADLKSGKKPKVEWLKYDWKLNDQNPVSKKR